MYWRFGDKNPVVVLAIVESNSSGAPTKTRKPPQFRFQRLLHTTLCRRNEQLGPSSGRDRLADGTLEGSRRGNA